MPATTPTRVASYTDTLRQLDIASLQIHACVHEARDVEPLQQAAALISLHDQVRAMGQLLNQALGGDWPPTAPDDEPC